MDAVAAQVPSALTSVDKFADPATTIQSLTDKVGPANTESAYQFDSSFNRYAKMKELNDNVFFYNANKINFKPVDFGNIGESVMNMAKNVRQKFDENIAQMQKEPSDASQGFTMQEMFERQMSGYITNMEFEMVSKMVSKSVENIYILLRQ